MGTEEEIAAKIRQGVPPRQLIAEGFKKSTVYKVFESLRAIPNTPAPPALFTVRMALDSERYLPGTTVQATFTVTNQSQSDLYILQAGARPEWIGSHEWVATTVRKLVGPGLSASIRIALPIPLEATLGEKEVYFAVQGQWLGPQASSPSAELMWTGPMLISVRRPATGLRVFISHSVFFTSLISQLEGTLEDNGILVALHDGLPGEDGQGQIDRADIVVAVITDPSRMSSVLANVDYARKRNKDLVLLIDAVLRPTLSAKYESLSWIVINFAVGTGSVLAALFSELDASIARHVARQKEQSDAIGVVLMALGALVAGVALSRGKPSP